MFRRNTVPALPDGEPHDLPTWTNLLLTEDTPIRWSTDPGTPEPGDELAGRLVIGREDQLIIDLCGTAVTNLLIVLVRAHHDANAPLPPDLQPVCQANARQADGSRGY